MDLTAIYKQHIRQIAKETLEQFELTSTAAEKKLSEVDGLSAESLAGVNTFTSETATRNLREVGEKNRASYEQLMREPAIARVVAKDEDGNQQTCYFCRGEQGMPGIHVISYMAPVGHLASIPVGEEFVRPDGHQLFVIERSLLRPAAKPEGWDSRDTVVEAEDFGPLTIESLRASLIESVGEEATENILDRLLAEESDKTNIIEGIRRSVITKMGLRDQPVLDQYQDEIFRLPIDNRLLLLGPPGTGKTTTLIRRLGQKLDTAFLDTDEKRMVEDVSADQGIMHVDSWLMFTPTELLKQYLKEAFAREGVPASDHRIRTWQDYRRELARNSFSVLRTTSGRGPFVLKNDLKSINKKAIESPIAWFEDFDKKQRIDFVLQLSEAVSRLERSEKTEERGLAERIRQVLDRVKSAGLVSTFAQLANLSEDVKSLVASLKEASDKKIKASLNFQLNRDSTFLDELVQFLDGLQQSQTADDDQDDLDSDEDEDTLAPRTGRDAAYNAYMKAVRAQARAKASGRKFSNVSRNGKIIEWLGDRGLSEADLAEVGESLIIQSSARQFVNPVKRYFDGIPRRYRAFRRAQQEEDSWYSQDGFEARDIHPLEVDIILLAILRAASDLLNRPNVLRDIDSPVWSSIKPILGYYRNQILVDEATDFSPIQLACMAALAHPRIRSFFACGDFNQRLTTWGTRSTNDLKWVFTDFALKEVTVSYRQSKQLNELAREIIHAVDGADQNISLPRDVDNEGVQPVLLEGAAERTVVVRWLAYRIREIEQFVGQLPSIAIFVNSEDDVVPVTDALNSALIEHNIQVIACREGQAVGQESNVRVFDIQHIKGLEFEAVFFLDIDQLAKLHPELFGKYLYVGATRAATYLGATCSAHLPPVIEDLRSLFRSDWKT